MYGNTFMNPFGVYNPAFGAMYYRQRLIRSIFGIISTLVFFFILLIISIIMFIASGSGFLFFFGLVFFCCDFWFSLFYTWFIYKQYKKFMQLAIQQENNMRAQGQPVNNMAVPQQFIQPARGPQPLGQFIPGTNAQPVALNPNMGQNTGGMVPQNQQTNLKEGTQVVY